MARERVVVVDAEVEVEVVGVVDGGHLSGTLPRSFGGQWVPRTSKMEVAGPTAKPERCTRAHDEQRLFEAGRRAPLEILTAPGR